MGSKGWYSNGKAVFKRLELGVIRGNARCTLWAYGPVRSCRARSIPLKVEIIILQWPGVGLTMYVLILGCSHVILL
jgi:hypothetical protein